MDINQFLSSQMMIAIIGGSGFIGTRLAKRLLDAGCDVRILDKSKSKTYPELWVNGDVRDKSSLLPALKGCDLLYNLAAEHRDDVTPRGLYRDVNVKGAENVCAAAEELGINKIIFTSSVAVYGFTDKETDERATGFIPPFTLVEGLQRTIQHEFINPCKEDEVVFYTE